MIQNAFCNEEKRIQELYSYQILDSDADFNLDEITQLAASICEVPIALISLVDKDRQWFKSKTGLEATQTARDISFCTHAIEQHELFLVEDSHKDERFKNNPLVLGQPNVRFYAGQPLKTPNGNNIGTLCVIDHQTKQLTNKQKEMLLVLSKQVINYFELYKAKKELETVRLDFIRKERQNSIANLSSGIAHEINNPLAIILGKISGITSKMEASENKILESLNLKRDMEVITNASNRISKIIKSLRDFSHCDDNEAVTEVSVKEIFQSIFFMFERKFSKDSIEVSLNIPDNLLIKCKLINLSHAFYNLILNSYESILTHSERWINISAVKNLDSSIVIQFVDSGNGIPKNLQARLMEPFVSSKEFMNLPKGLGLCIAKGIIQANNGFLKYLENARNTTFEVQLNMSC
ncbi:GAF domain-containing sensor histidine kinase [Pigmentibacter sp. JX0631]|uniref:GAF domain-containing sensor histidine kinase n=1 Tax=Pigmentibacter sp. JX0631 TaxID=2976982 RepID=UPI0024684411|nr:GAF domain-containing sensor histidine kinase [Pigmentibacter sp. JX0631]WGL59122.1 GAF domain-containing sensor histidine kinase [Pigmentibacter sp. JX0631]